MSGIEEEMGIYSMTFLFLKIVSFEGARYVGIKSLFCLIKKANIKVFFSPAEMSVS